MDQMTDMMVDVETTGLCASTNGIIQIGAVKFNAETRQVGGAFDRCPSILPKRLWDDSTREFWQVKHKDVYHTIIARQEPYPQVFKDFLHFCGDGKPEGGYRFWAKPLHFDWGFLSDHFEQLGAGMPFHYRTARDMGSYIAGLRGSPDHFSMDNVVPFTGSPHNALHDAAWQLDGLFAAMDGNFSEILA